MKMSRHQKGASLYNILIYVVIIGLSAAMILQVVPAYIDNASVKSALESLDNHVGITGKSKKKIKSIIRKQLTVNNVRDIPLEHLKVQKKKGKLIVTFDYDKKIPIAQNMFLLIEFKNKYEAVSH